jgi:hypothetical protein
MLYVSAETSTEIEKRAPQAKKIESQIFAFLIDLLSTGIYLKWLSCFWGPLQPAPQNELPSNKPSI